MNKSFNRFFKRKISFNPSLIVGLTSLLMSNLCWAIPRQIQVSNSFGVQLPAGVVETPIYLPSLKTYHLQTQFQGQPVRLSMTWGTPPTLANQFSVNRYWNDSRKQTEAVALNEKNLGCKKIRTGVFQCQRTSIQNEKPVTEILVWNGKQDLVLIRGTARTSLELSESFVAKIQLKIDTRFPAGARK